MPTGHRQHIVPQMMIRRFAGDDGALVELHKPTLRIGTKRRQPKGILFRDHFYRDRVGDFDEDLLKKVEQKFKKYYPRIANGSADAIAGDGDAGAALIDWIASMLCRTTGFIRLSRAAAAAAPKSKNSTIFGMLGFALAPDLMHNILRSHQFTEYQDWLSRPNWKWKVKQFTEGDHLVLTDNPVCMTRVATPGGMIVVVPLTKRRILLGGLANHVEKCRHWSVAGINAYLAAWAERSIFAADNESLKGVVRTLQGDGVIADPGWCEAARKPLLGITERIAAQPVPGSVDLDQFNEYMKGLYGPSILAHRHNTDQ